MAEATADTVTSVPVAVVGAGPAGLMLAHLLGRAGVDTVVVDTRTRQEIATTHRAGILEADVARDLVETGVSDRVVREGHEHEGIELRFGGRPHRIDFKELVGASTWLYPQTDVFTDLADARERDGGTVLFGIEDTEVLDITTDAPGSAAPCPTGAGARSGPGTWSAPTVRAACAATWCPRTGGCATARSTRSPGSASWPRPRRARPSWSTPTPSTASR